MRKVILALLAAAGIMIACQKTELAAPEKGAVIHARTEQPVDTRTSMDDKRNIRWSEGDQVVAFMKSTLASKFEVIPSSVGKTSADFKEVPSDNGGLHSGNALPHNIVYYPYDPSVECGIYDEGYALSVVLPSVQTYVPDSFGNGTFPMVAVSDNNNITFRNVSGGIRLSFKGNQRIASIKIEGKNNERLSGSATVMTGQYGSNPDIKLSSDAATTITLDCGEGIRLDEETARDFIIALPPVKFSAGFTVLVTDHKGNGYIVETDKQNTVYRSSILVMPEVTLGEEPDIPAWEDMPDYIDENGVNRGPGVNIDDVVWAPVNCGYHETDYPYGKLYQWGRKYGQGYCGNLYDINGDVAGTVSDATFPSVERGPAALDYGQSIENQNFIFSGNYDNDYNWLSPEDDTLWNTGTDSDPLKTRYDPCPYGWRVPTYGELKDLCGNYSDQVTNDIGQNGRWVSGNAQYSIKSNQIFLPAAGNRSVYHLDTGEYRGLSGKYWSSTPNRYYGCHCILTGSDDITRESTSCCLSVRCVYDPDADHTSNITLSFDSMTIYEGDTEHVSAYVRPDYPNSSAITWSSDSPDVATIDQNGVITAVSAGKATITAVAGGYPATCSVLVLPFAGETIDYIDEYGINHGKGISVGMAIWAPVNCGYHRKDYPYGKLYQWGRKYGQGYSEEYDATIPTIAEGGVTLEEGESLSNADTFFCSENNWDWHETKDDSLWGKYGSKTVYDPCPEGWRVPTYDELSELKQNYSKWSVAKYHAGRWFSGPDKYSEDTPGIFLPAAGHRNGEGEAYGREVSGGYWSSKLEQGNYGYSSRLLSFDKSLVNMEHFSCACGYSVRCVQE